MPSSERAALTLGLGISKAGNIVNAVNTTEKTRLGKSKLVGSRICFATAPIGDMSGVYGERATKVLAQACS